jgi:hypothetical protein
MPSEGLLRVISLESEASDRRATVAGMAPLKWSGYMQSVPNDETKLGLLHRQLLADPKAFLLHDWPNIEWPDTSDSEEAIFAVPDDAWTGSLIAWAEAWGRDRLAMHKRREFRRAQKEWGSRRPDLFRTLEIGSHSIRNGLDNTELAFRYGFEPTLPAGVAGEFAEVWAVTEGNEVAAAGLTAALGRTEVSAFVLAGPNEEYPEWYRLTGKMVYHVVGDPRNPDLATFMKHADEWSTKCAGITIRRGGGQAATFPTRESLQAAFDELSAKRRKYPTQAQLALEYGVTERAIRDTCSTFGVRWRDLKQSRK